MLGSVNAAFTPLTCAPAATALIDASIELFSVLFVKHSSRIQESLVAQLRSFKSSPLLSKDPGRLAAIAFNIDLALLHALEVVLHGRVQFVWSTKCVKLVLDLLKVISFC